MGIIFDAIKGVVPPHPTDYATPELYEVGVRRHRWKMFYGLVGVWLLALGMAGASFGVFPSFYPGFASASAQSDTQDEVTAIRVGQLEARIFNLRKDHCTAVKEGRSGAAYWEQLQPLLRQYVKLTGSAFILPLCSEL